MYKKNNLTEFLNVELERRGWSVRELALRAELSHSGVANVVNGSINPTPKWCKAVARAIDVAPEHLLRKMYLLDPDKGEDVQEIVELFNGLNGDRKALAKRFMKMLYEN